MNTLHTVNKSPFERNSLSSCLRLAMAESSILLFEDGVYAALQGTEFSETLQTALAKHSIYVLVPDLQARGMSLEQVIAGVQAVDYAGFVDLTTTHYPIQAWL